MWETLFTLGAMAMGFVLGYQHGFGKAKKKYQKDPVDDFKRVNRPKTPEHIVKGWKAE